MSLKLSDASNRLQGQPMFKILAEVKKLERQGENIIHFEIGDPDFSTPDHIAKSAIESIESGNTHYVPSDGLFRLKESVAKTTLRSRGFTPDLDQILICPGANIIIYYAIQCLMNPGEEVIVSDPAFPTYFSVFSFCNVTPVKVPLSESDNFIMRADEIEKRITSKTKLIIINSPQNPTGAVIPEDELKKIYNLAKKYNLFLLSDEVYSRVVYDESYKFYSPSSMDQCNENTIIINGFSKIFAMTGWRLGVAIAPAFVIEKMKLLLETTSSCVPPFIQDAGVAAIEGDQSVVKKMIDTYKRRRDILVDGLNKIKGISCNSPKGALYLFVNISELKMTSEEVAQLFLQKAKVAVLPGTNFGEAGEGFIRLSFCIKEDLIIEGLKRIENLLGKK